MATPRPLAPLRSPRAPIARRVVLVVADGLRPDIIPLLDLPNIGRLVGQGASTLRATTVRPSVTAAAMASLLTGAPPEVHGLRSDRFRVPRPSGPVEPLPATLAAAGIRTRAWMAAVPWAFRRLARTLVTRLGFHEASFAGQNAAEVLDHARRDLARSEPGCDILHWPDADRAGHRQGWPSPAYLRAARAIDRAVGDLADITGAAADPGALLVVLADHGGGGALRREHDSDHPNDVRIPVLIAGGAVRRGELLAGTSLLDVPPTILHALGVGVPASYTGRVLHEAFLQVGRPAWHRDRMTEVAPMAAAG